MVGRLSTVTSMEMFLVRENCRCMRVKREENADVAATEAAIAYPRNPQFFPLISEPSWRKSFFSPLPCRGIKRQNPYLSNCFSPLPPHATTVLDAKQSSPPTEDQQLFFPKMCFFLGQCLYNPKMQPTSYVRDDYLKF